MMKRREVVLAWVPWTVVLLLVCSSAVVVQHTQAKQIEAKEELVRLHNEVLANQRDLQSHHLELVSRGRLEARFNERLQQLEKMYSEQLQELDDRLRLLEQQPQTN